MGRGGGDASVLLRGGPHLRLFDRNTSTKRRGGRRQPTRRGGERGKSTSIASGLHLQDDLTTRPARQRGRNHKTREGEKSKRATLQSGSKAELGQSKTAIGTCDRLSVEEELEESEKKEEERMKWNATLRPKQPITQAEGFRSPAMIRKRKDRRAYKQLEKRGVRRHNLSVYR